MAGFIFPTIAEQQSGYFGKDGVAGRGARLRDEQGVPFLRKGERPVGGQARGIAHRNSGVRGPRAHVSWAVPVGGSGSSVFDT